MNAILVAEKDVLIGEQTVIEGAAPEGNLAVVFEDDGKTGYFYAVDISIHENPILEALHIYDVESVLDRDEAIPFQIIWSNDNHKAALLIDHYPHGVFDFTAKRAFSRTGFPPPEEGGWARVTENWDEEARRLFVGDSGQ